MYELAPLIYDLAIMLGLASIVALLFQAIRQPIVLGYLVAGMIIGPHTPPYAFVTDIHNIQILSELGVIFLMFSLGLEFSFQKLMRVGLPAGVTGSIEVILMTMIGYSVGRILGWPHYDSLFLGAALSISSTTIIIKAIDELGLKTKRFAEFIFAILIVEDLLAILLLVALSTLVNTKNVFSFDLVTAFIRLVVVVGGWFLTGYLLIVPFYKTIADSISQENLTLISVASCLFLVCIAANLHYSTPLGAFIMGSILAETPLIHRIYEIIRPIRDVFAAVFFISVGMLIDPSIIIQQWPTVLLLSVVTVLGKVFSTSVGALISGQSFDRALRSGFGMAQIGEFSFIIITLGLTLEAVDTKIYPLIVAVSGVTTFTTPYLIRFSGVLSKTMDMHLPARIKYLQQKYASWIYRMNSNHQNRNLVSAIGLRVLFNSIMVAIIYTLIHYSVFHYFAILSENNSWACLGFLLISLLVTAPFIWGMLFAHRVIFPDNTARNLTYLNIAVALIWVVTFLEVLLLSIVYFNNWTTTIIFFVISILGFWLAYRRLETSYMWLEQRLMSNVNLAKNGTLTYKELAPWDAHLTEVVISEHSSLINKTISEVAFPTAKNLIFLAIGRDNKIIYPHCQHLALKANDQLIVVGAEEDVELFKQETECQAWSIQSGKYLALFLLLPLLIGEKHYLVNKTIQEAHSIDLLPGKIVGLERAGERLLNPNKDIKLDVNDLLLIVKVIGTELT